VIIDHGTQTGFARVAEAREYLLRKGRKQVGSEPEGIVKLGKEVRINGVLMREELRGEAAERADAENAEDVGYSIAASKQGCHVVAPVSHGLLFLSITITN